MTESFSPISDPTGQSTLSFERLVLAFEKSWHLSSVPDIHQFVSSCDPCLKSSLLYELIQIDMEFRWKASSQGHDIDDSLGGQPSCSDYVRFLPELNTTDQISAELIAEEYRIRQLWGDQPSHNDFELEKSEYGLSLTKWLVKIDEELQADCEGKEQPRLPNGTGTELELSWSDYLLKKYLGSGGFGKVYWAIQKSLQKSVAIKSLHKSLQRDPQAVLQFLQEFQLLSRLQHKNIVGAYGTGRYPGGGYFLVLEFVKGEDFQQILNRRPLVLDEAVQATIAVAEAIQHAHDHRVAHGDLKPSNVLVDENNHVFVTDFGLAHLLPSYDDLSNSQGVLGGTIAYMAPEIVQGAVMNVAVDVYGLGALLYALLTNQPPQKHDDVETMMVEVERRNALVSPSLLRTDIPDDLAAIVMKCLEESPANRFSTADDVARELSRWQISQ